MMLGCNVPLSLHAEVILLHYVLLYGTTWSCVPSSHALFNWGMLANPELYPMKAASKVELGNQGLLGYVSANTTDLVALAVLIISSWCCPSRFKTIGFWAEARMSGVERMGLHWDYFIFSDLSFWTCDEIYMRLHLFRLTQVEIQFEWPIQQIK